MMGPSSLEIFIFGLIVGIFLTRFFTEAKSAIKAPPSREKDRS